MELKGVLFVTILLYTSSVISAQSISPLLIEGEVGMNVTFNCTSAIPGDAESNVLEGQVDGSFAVFGSTEQASGRLSVNNDGSTSTFTFGPLLSSDNGLLLRCISGDDFTPNAMISVIFAVMINDVNLDNRTITLTENRGVPFNLTIDVVGNPFPTYTWTRNGVLVMNESILTVAPKTFYAYAVRENTGFYEVVYVNRLGSIRYNFSLDIQYQSEFPADPVEDSPETQCDVSDDGFICTARTGSRVTLLCNAVGNPTPVVTVNPATAPISDNKIVFTTVAMSDAGTYTCTASSPGFADVSRQFQLMVGGPPGSVSELTTTINLDASTITFTWKYDDSSNRLPITGFDVIIVQDMGGTDPITMELSPDQLSFSLPLSRFMNQMSYTISVTVKNAQGSGVPIFDPFTIPGSSAINIGAFHIFSLLIISLIVLLF